MHNLELQTLARAQYSATKPLLALHGVELCVTYDSCDAFVKVKFKVFILLRTAMDATVRWLDEIKLLKIKLYLDEATDC